MSYLDEEGTNDVIEKLNKDVNTLKSLVPYERKLILKIRDITVDFPPAVSSSQTVHSLVCESGNKNNSNCSIPYSYTFSYHGYSYSNSDFLSVVKYPVIQLDYQVEFDGDEEKLYASDSMFLYFNYFNVNTDYNILNYGINPGSTGTDVVLRYGHEYPHKIYLDIHGILLSKIATRINSGYGIVSSLTQRLHAINLYGIKLNYEFEKDDV